MTPQARFAALSLLLITAVIVGGCEYNADSAPSAPRTPESRALDACQELAGASGKFQFQTGRADSARGFTCSVAVQDDEDKRA